MAKKVCITGTAPSWKMTPWHDRSWEIWSLNDAWMLRPQRWDRWYELHPIDQMWFRDPAQRVIDASQIPKGHYVRPQGHLEWLKAQAAHVPVFLQKEPPDDWPANAHRFPIEAVEAEFGSSYWASGPAYMLAQAVLEGYTEIMITGIHLATEAEYREQRPQWENLIGRILGRSIKESTQPDGMRVYDGADVRIVLPPASVCPILSHGWKYAYEHKPDPPPNPYRTELKQTVKMKNRLVEQLIVWPAAQDKSAALEQLRRLTVIEEDCQVQLARAAQAEQFGPILAVLGG
jgi:hypothetical protein